MPYANIEEQRKAQRKKLLIKEQRNGKKLTLSVTQNLKLYGEKITLRKLKNKVEQVQNDLERTILSIVENIIGSIK